MFPHCWGVGASGWVSNSFYLKKTFSTCLLQFNIISFVGKALDLTVSHFWEQSSLSFMFPYNVKTIWASKQMWAKSYGSNGASNRPSNMQARLLGHLSQENSLSLIHFVIASDYTWMFPDVKKHKSTDKQLRRSKVDRVRSSEWLGAWR